MKAQAYRDLSYVAEYLKARKAKCSSLQGVREVRLEAVKERAHERGVQSKTVYRNLKFALKIDKQGGSDHLDLWLLNHISP